MPSKASEARTASTPSSNTALNAAIAFWIAKTVMDRDGYRDFINWANGAVDDRINGDQIDKNIVKKLNEHFTTPPAAFREVLNQLGTAMGEWDPHVNPFRVMDAISNLSPTHAA